MNTFTPKNLIVTASFAVIMLLGAHTASAYVAGVWEPQPRVQTNEPAFTKVATSFDEPFTPQKSTNTPLSNSTTTTTTNTTNNTNNTVPANSTTTTNKTVSRNTTSNTNRTYVASNTNRSYVASNTSNSASNLPPVTNYNSGASGFGSTSGNGLTALSVQGSGGFFPSSIWQWLLVILLICAVVVIARMFKKTETHHAPAH